MGHIAIAYLLFLLYDRGRHYESQNEWVLVILIFGSLFPDLLDKPLAWYIGVLPTGRSLAHSLLFLIPLCVLVYLLARHRGFVVGGVAFAIGAISHTLVDALPVLWDPDASAAFLLYPVWDVGTYENGSPTVLGLLQDSLYDPYFLAEFVLLAIAMYYWYTRGKPGISLARSWVRTLRSRI